MLFLRTITISQPFHASYLSNNIMSTDTQLDDLSMTSCKLHPPICTGGRTLSCNLSREQNNLEGSSQVQELRDVFNVFVWHFDFYFEYTDDYKYTKPGSKEVYSFWMTMADAAPP